jgi:hypothetical protein
LDFFPIWKNFHNAGQLKRQSVLSSGVETQRRSRGCSADVPGREVAAAHARLQRQALVAATRARLQRRAFRWA